MRVSVGTIRGLLGRTFSGGNPSAGGKSSNPFVEMRDSNPAGGAAGGPSVATKTSSSQDNNKALFTEVTRRNFPNITIDFVTDTDARYKRLGYSVIADTIFDHLKLKRSEFDRFRTFGEEDGKQTLKIRTTADIDVKRRYGASPKFEVRSERDGLVWEGTIRGAVPVEVAEAEETVKLRVVNPPEEAAFSEIVTEVQKFAEVRSDVREEVVPAELEPRLAGYPTGIVFMRIKKGARVPPFMKIRRQKVRIHVALHPNVCLKCHENGHRAAECQRREANDEDPAVMEGEKSEEEAEEEQKEEIELGFKGERKEGNEPRFEEDQEETPRGEKMKGGGPSVVKPVRGGGGTARGRGRGGGGSGIRTRSTSELKPSAK